MVCVRIDQRSEIKKIRRVNSAHQALSEGGVVGRAKGIIINRVNVVFTLHRPKGLLFRPCGPFCVGAGSRRQRNAAHSLQRRMRMLKKKKKS